VHTGVYKYLYNVAHTGKLFSLQMLVDCRRSSKSRTGGGASAVADVLQRLPTRRSLGTELSGDAGH